MRNRITRYEVTAQGAGRTWLVGYTPRKTEPGLCDVIFRHGQALCDALEISEDQAFTVRRKPRLAAVMTGTDWIVGFSGRTQIDAQDNGEHRFICQ